MRPLVLLDVDGVINGLMGDIPVAIESHGWKLRIPDYMPKLIQAIHAVAEIRWLTTWREYANDDIAPFLGIPPLGVVTDGKDGRYVEWKPLAALPHITKALDAGREVYWIEDHEYRYEGGPWQQVTMITTLPHYVLRPSMVPEHLGGWNGQEG